MAISRRKAKITINREFYWQLFGQHLFYETRVSVYGNCHLRQKLQPTLSEKHASKCKGNVFKNQTLYLLEARGNSLLIIPNVLWSDYLQLNVICWLCERLAQSVVICEKQENYNYIKHHFCKIYVQYLNNCLSRSN